MSWGKVDDHGDEETAHLSDHAFRLFWSAIPFNRRRGLGGRMSDRDVRLLMRQQGVKSYAAVQELIDDPEISWAADGTDVVIRAYPKYNPPTSKERTREYRRRLSVTPDARHSDVTVTPDERHGDADATPSVDAVTQPSRGRVRAGSPKPVPVPVPIPEASASGRTLIAASDRPTVEIIQGAGVGGMVAAFVEGCSSVGVDPLPDQRARVGKQAKKLLDAHKPPGQVLVAIERMVARNRPPESLPYLVAELEREAVGATVQRPDDHRGEGFGDRTIRELYEHAAELRRAGG